MPTDLSTPLTLNCGQILGNRIMKSALSEALARRDNSPSKELENLFGRWSAGGYGLIVTGNVMVDRTQLGEPGNVVIEDDRDRESLSRWAKSAKNGGSLVWMQLNHPGRQANSLITKRRPLAPSAIVAKVPGSTKPREMTPVEIEDTIARFGTAARIAEESGFDGVQIHGAHGYLVTQFLSPRANQRTDDWGGDPERRMRFLLEIVRTIRSNVSPGFGVGLKLNSSDFQRGGFSEEESRGVVECLSSEDIDLLEISGGTYESPAMMGSAKAESTKQREAYFLEYAEKVRDVSGGIPIAVTGGFRTRAMMIEALESGVCDVIGLGRPTCTTPEAGRILVNAEREVLHDSSVKFGLRQVAGKVTDLKALDGLIDLQWHTDQLHRMGMRLEPDLDRPWWKTLATTARRNGVDAFWRKRG